MISTSLDYATQTNRLRAVAQNGFSGSRGSRPAIRQTHGDTIIFDSRRVFSSKFSGSRVICRGPYVRGAGGLVVRAVQSK